MPEKKLDRFFDLSKRNLQVYLGISIVVFLFILFFQPFAIDRLKYENRLPFVAGFGVIILVTLFLNQIIFQKLLLRPESDNRQDALLLSLYLFSLVASTSLAFIFYLRFVGDGQVTFTLVVKVIFICISLPVTIQINSRLRSCRQRLDIVEEANQKLKNQLSRLPKRNETEFIELVSDSESNNLRLRVSDIVFLRSADNYVEVGYQDNNHVKKQMIRSTLKDIEEQLRNFHYFIRTHRTSILNIEFIDSLHKDLSSHWLSLLKSKETIPVSRQYLNAVKAIL